MPPLIPANLPPVLGIDPGVNGGFCIVSFLTGEPLHVHAFHGKDEEGDVVWELNHAIDSYAIQDCILERVGYMRGDGGKGAFTFGRVYGLLRGVLHTRGVRIHDAPPMLWQGRLGCLSGGNKNVTKRKALEMFPQWKKAITHNTADAMLIARYGWMVLSGGIFS